VAKKHATLPYICSAQLESQGSVKFRRLARIIQNIRKIFRLELQNCRQKRKSVVHVNRLKKSGDQKPWNPSRQTHQKENENIKKPET
jgi:hypothetical protein